MIQSTLELWAECIVMLVFATLLRNVWYHTIQTRQAKRKERKAMYWSAFCDKNLCHYLTVKTIAGNMCPCCYRLYPKDAKSVIVAVGKKQAIPLHALPDFEMKRHYTRSPNWHPFVAALFVSCVYISIIGLVFAFQVYFTS